MYRDGKASRDRVASGDQDSEASRPGAASAPVATDQEPSASQVDAAVAHSAGIMERYEILGWIPVPDCRDQTPEQTPGALEAWGKNAAQQFVVEALMDYYNRKG